jgi:ABC-type dipeptide/oligopeptide/nickel transport system permease component
VLVIFGVLSLLFVTLRAAGSPADALAGANASPADVARISKQLGLDRPILTQYWDFISKAARFNFGDSYQTRTSAIHMVLDRLPATLGLILCGIVLAIIVAVPLGMAAALTRSRIYARLMDVIVVIGQALPVFAVGVILVFVFAVKLKWVPSIAPSGFSSPVSSWILPIIVLSLHPISRILEVARTGLSESMQDDFIRTAQSKGVSPWGVVLRHAIRPVLTSLVTVVGVDLAQLLSGAVIIEVIFTWPGIGPVLVTAVSGRDYPVVAAATYVFAVLVVLLNLVIDVAYRQLDPRIRRGR